MLGVWRTKVVGIVVCVCVKMDRKKIMICGIVGFLGLVSAVLGFIAEANRIKGSQVMYSSPTECLYPRSPALALGLSAAVSLLIGQIIINIATGCICCFPRQSTTTSSNWTFALFAFVLSWFTFIIAFLLLLTGAALNDDHGGQNVYFGSYYCYVVKPGVFAGAATLSLSSLLLGIIYYLILTSTTKVSGTHGIVMGHPSRDPVFVHEDTFARRQLS